MESTIPTAADCAYHPGRVAEAACAECASAICDECRETVAGKPVCRRCVEAIRARVTAQADQAATPLQPAAPKYNFSVPSSGTGAPNADISAPSLGGDTASETGAATPAAPTMRPAVIDDDTPPTAARLLLGVLLGIIAGVVCAFLYDKFVLYTGIGLGIIAGAIGWGVGFAVAFGCGKGGLLPAIIGGTLAFASMIFSRYLLVNDMIAKELGGAAGTLPLFSFETFEIVFSMMNFMTWIIVAIGTYGGFSMPYRAGTVSDD